MASALPVTSRRLTTLIYMAFGYSWLAMAIVQGIFMAPLYISRIGVDLYGAWLATGNVLTLIELSDPGLADIIRQRVGGHYGKKDVPAMAGSIGTGLAMSFVQSMVPLLAWPFAGMVAHYVRVTGPTADTLAWCFRLGLVGSALTLASYGASGVNLALMRILEVGTIQTVGTLAGLGTIVYLLLTGAGLRALPVGMLVRGVIMFVGNVVQVILWTRRHLEVRPYVSRAEFRQMLGLSAFTFTSRLGTSLLDRMDNIITTRVLGNAATVMLSFTSRAFDPARSVPMQFASAFMPSLTHLAGEQGAKGSAAIIARIARVTGWISAISLACVIALNGVFMSLWVGAQFFGGQRLTAVLGVAVAMTIFSMVLNRVIYSLGGIRQSAGASLVEALIKLPLQIVLVRALGLVGMPLASCVGALLVSGWYQPSVAARLLGQTRWQQLRIWVQNLGVVIALGALASVVHLGLTRLDLPWTWPLFAGVAVMVGAGFSTLALVADGTLRRDLLGEFAAWRLRRAGAAA